MTDLKRVLVSTATYNEADNIEHLISDIFTHCPGAEVLVVDDASPDGTGRILESISRLNERVHVIHRPRKLGLGTAHKLAMKYAIYHEFDALVTMDADFSHNPKYLQRIMEHLLEEDFVIGSRYMEGGSSDYGLSRTALSKTANYLARFVLRIPLHECTTSYRGFRVSLLKQTNIDRIRSNGYSFFVESLFCICLLTKKLGEFPIAFEDRRAGESKISKTEIIKGVITLVRLFLKKTFSIRLLKRLSGEREDYSCACSNCGNRLLTEIYPSTSSSDSESQTFRCTSRGHKSHGRIVRCLQCGLMFADTAMSSTAINELYEGVEDVEYVQNLEARYRTFRYNLSYLQSILPQGGALLDVGAYCGAFVKVAKESGYDATGVEPSKWAAQYAVNSLNQDVVQGTLDSLPRGKVFDIVTLWDVLEHMPNPLQELSAIHDRLRPGGYFAFSTLNVANWVPRILGEKWPWIMDMHLYYFTPDTLGHMLKKSGFNILIKRPYCHIITLDYLWLKLGALGVPGMRALRSILSRTPLGKLYIPFRLGDVQMFLCRKRVVEQDKIDI